MFNCRQSHEKRRVPPGMDIVKKLASMDNNYKMNRSVYIHPENIKKMLSSEKEVLDLLITPFLIGERDQEVYELLYYKTYSEVINDGESETITYDSGNLLPAEVTSRIFPGAYINKNDIAFFNGFWSSYFNAMEKMKFNDDTTATTLLKKGAQIFYEVV